MDTYCRVFGNLLEFEGILIQMSVQQCLNKSLHICLGNTFDYIQKGAKSMSEFCSELRCINAESTCELMDVFNAGIIITCSSFMARILTHCCKISYIMAFVQWGIDILRVLTPIRELKNLICCVPFKYNKQMNY